MVTCGQIVLPSTTWGDLWTNRLAKYNLVFANDASAEIINILSFLFLIADDVCTEEGCSCGYNTGNCIK